MRGSEAGKSVCLRFPHPPALGSQKRVSALTRAPTQEHRAVLREFPEEEAEEKLNTVASAFRAGSYLETSSEQILVSHQERGLCTGRSVSLLLSLPTSTPEGRYDLEVVIRIGSSTNQESPE